MSSTLRFFLLLSDVEFGFLRRCVQFTSFRFILFSRWFFLPLPSTPPPTPSHSSSSLPSHILAPSCSRLLLLAISLMPTTTLPYSSLPPPMTFKIKFHSLPQCCHNGTPPLQIYLYEMPIPFLSTTTETATVGFQALPTDLLTRRLLLLLLFTSSLLVIQPLPTAHSFGTSDMPVGNPFRRSPTS